jgi:hypothetical protein
LSFKSWVIPFLSAGVGIGFTLFSFVTGQEITESQYKLFEYLILMTLGSGAIGATKSGFSKYQEYKKQ